MRHVDDGAARHTYLALLAADGRLTVLENDQPDNLAEYTPVDEFTVCPRPSRGEEVSFRVRFDPSPEPCYAAQRSGVGADSLGIVVAAMDQVRVYRSRDVVATSYGVHSTRKEFYLAADLNDAATAPTAANAPAYASAPAATHRGLVRDVAWAPGNIRGYDTIATACQDGFSRVFRLDTPLDPSGPGPTGTNTNTSWSQAAVFAASAPVDNTPATTAASTPPAGPSSAPTDGTATPVTTEQAAAAAATPTSTSEPTPATADASPADAAAEEGDDEQEDDIPDDGSVSTAAVDSPISQQDQTHQTQHQLPPHITNPLHQPHHHPSSTLSASLAHSNAAAARDRVWSGAPGQVKHQAHLVSKLGDAFRTPVWRIGFDDDGQILGTTGDDGKLVCFRQTPDGSWALSSELAMMRARMVAP